MTVPLVAELSACTSTYGRLAPVPPVAAAQAGTARAKIPPRASSAALATNATTRLRYRMDRNIFAPFGAAVRWIASWSRRSVTAPGDGARRGEGQGQGESNIH